MRAYNKSKKHKVRRKFSVTCFIYNEYLDCYDINQYVVKNQKVIKIRMIGRYEEGKYER